MITLILAEAELELIPKSIQNHPAVRSQAKQRNKSSSKLILDASFHHSAMKTINEGRRRGRPDITHIFLLTVLESIANKEENIKQVIIHTRNDEAIYINPKTRIMRNYTRFIGLMEQLYEKETISTEDMILLELQKNKTLKQIIKESQIDHIVCFTNTGKKTDLSIYFSTLKTEEDKDILFIIGGFPSGEFHNDITEITNEQLSIYPEKLTAWTVANEVLTHYQTEYEK